jgi:hypothetical protein
MIYFEVIDQTLTVNTTLIGVVVNWQLKCQTSTMTINRKIFWSHKECRSKVSISVSYLKVSIRQKQHQSLDQSYGGKWWWFT